MILGIDNDGAALVGGSILTSGGKMKTMKIVGVGKAVYVKMEKGSVLLQPGDILDAPENEAKIVIGTKRARLFDPALDAPPVVIEPEPEPEPEVVETKPLYVGGAEPLDVTVGGTSKKRKGG